MNREMLVGFSEVDEERTIEAFEECEEVYGVEELNILEGLPERGEFTPQVSFPVITLEV